MAASCEPVQYILVRFDRVVAACALFLAPIGPGRDVAAQAIGADVLLHRAAAYVADFEMRFSNVVAEEHYIQQAPDRLRGPARRELASDFLLVKVPSDERWLPFRDVFEVDGRPVRDRQDRLTKLFLQPAATAIEQANAIVAESARYNVGIRRNINVPVFALLVLRSNNQRRFRFENLRRNSKSGPDTWLLDYKEQSPPTLIHGADNSELFTHGSFSIEAATGRVLRSELRISNPTLRVQVTTEYRFDEGFGVAIPVEMRESYGNPRFSAQTTGVATYSHFRRFVVQTEEKIRD
jgi:hypothetical protein